MSVREKLLEIGDLKISERLIKMGQNQYDEYILSLNNFVDTFPQVQASIIGALGKKDIGILSEKVTALQETLVVVGAEDIAAECKKYLTVVSSENSSKFESYVSYFLSRLAALSIDIQMALFQDGEPVRKAEPAKEAPASPKPLDFSVLEKQAAPAEPKVERVILAVDDDPHCLDLFKMALKDVHCKIIAVTSAPAALGILKKQKVDLFVFDIDMPVINGLDLAKKVKDEGFHNPIVFITGNAQKEAVVGAMKLGAADFIMKPINPQNVVGRITKFV